MSFANRIGTAAALALLVLAAACSKKEVSFARDVNPILQKNCLGCHSPGGKGYVASGFSVESYADVMKGTRYGSVILPGYSISSTIERLIEHKAHPSIHMPQGQPQLPREELDVIKAWIDEGAKDN
ncbi:MAG: c-type cytochrome domain-containing protein [Burkholderiaceae bacterium]